MVTYLICTCFEIWKCTKDARSCLCVNVLNDCHGVPKSQGSAPVRDEVDNYTVMRGIQNDTHTVLEFRRALDTCDPDDYILSSDTVRVIWAMHEKDPHYNFEMVYHGASRGSQSLHLLAPSVVPKPDQAGHVRNWDVTLKNMEVKQDMNTMYWCKIFKAPTLNQKHHIIGYEPIIGANHSSYVHHMLLHECPVDPRELRKWEAYSREDGKACYSPEMPVGWEKCLSTVVAWAVGSKGEIYPEHVGLPIAEKRNSFYMLQVHFDNPSMKRAVDTSGIRLLYTNKLRPNEAGILVTGVALSTLHVIPPQQKEYRSAGYCSFNCTKVVLPKTGINVVSVLMHSHLAGRKMKLRHVRGEKELLPIAQDNHYDFNFQQSRRLSHGVNILPGDSLITECTYSTMDRNKPTLGGYSTSEEMCLAFILHYPRTDLAECFSMPPIKYFFENLGVKEFYDKSFSDIERIVLEGGSDNAVVLPTTKAPLFTYKPGDEHSPEANEQAILAIQNAKDYTIEGESSNLSLLERLIIKEPQEFRNKSFMAHLQDIPYNETILTQTLEEYFYTGLHLTFCRRKNDTLAFKQQVENFPKFVNYSTNETGIRCSYRTRQLPSDAPNLRPHFTNHLLLPLLISLLISR
ncbi:PREDICTED: MOXD1 homolog 1 [Nicrophorus vespilloides]|uniref:MOXD1 homolog 1 n=1 Tax=Nicrophorus vespilloides TaxID=110193 RepID=A0ABM1M8Q7_NICVS|nr:PREDICTED: MOXD1 homolog 1 [Nicrophorus vespilloides]